MIWKLIKVDFFYEGEIAGSFPRWRRPEKPGKYVYGAYRSCGHLRMTTDVSKTGLARCYYDSGKNRVFFSVVNCPNNFVLELADFELIDHQRDLQNPRPDLTRGCSLPLDVKIFSISTAVLFAAFFFVV